MTDRTPGHGDHEHDLVMPFVVCKDQGGPYDAKSFVAGYEAATFEATLRNLMPYGGVVERWVPPDLVPQLDLLAMKYGGKLRTFDSDESGEWIRIRAGHPGLVDESPDRGDDGL